jgi:hypothetical protein
MKVINVVGARPNFMKIAPIIRAIKSFNHTNQRNLSRLPCSESVRGLPCSESVRGEMRPALWSVETTTWGAYFTGTQQTKETISAVNEK